MSLLSRLFAPVARLFGRRRRAASRFEPLDLGQRIPTTGEGAQSRSVPVVTADVAVLVPAAPPPVEAFPPLPYDAATVEVDEGEESFEEEERAHDAPDDEDAEAELDLRPDLDVIVAERHSRLDDTRREAEQAALSSEQRVRLTDPAGPGTLAETLSRLEREGRVTSVLADDDGEPVLLYTPVDAEPRPVPH